MELIILAAGATAFGVFLGLVLGNALRNLGNMTMAEEAERQREAFRRKNAAMRKRVWG